MAEIQRGNEPGREPDIKLEPGLRSYPLPDMRQQGPGIKSVPTAEVAQNKLNQILNSITEQGGTLLGVIPVEVAMSLPSGGVSNDESGVLLPFLIINK